MMTTPLEWGRATDTSGYHWDEKNRGWGKNYTTISTLIALFVPGVFGTHFINF
jgi:hypothetical protein